MRALLVAENSFFLIVYPALLRIENADASLARNDIAARNSA
jgi:hypothetical protein